MSRDMNQKKSVPAEKFVVKKLLSAVQDSTGTFIKEAKILRELQYKKIVSFKAVCKEPFSNLSNVPNLNDVINYLWANVGILLNSLVSLPYEDLCMYCLDTISSAPVQAITWHLR